MATTVANWSEGGERLSKGAGYGWAATGDVRRGATFIFLGWALEQAKIEAQKIAADPPRDDYDIPTGVRAGRIRAEDVKELVVDPLARVPLRASSEVDYAAAYMSAHLRAFERLQGAVAAGAPGGIREARSTEAMRHGIDAARYLSDAAVTLQRLAQIEVPREASSSRGPDDAPSRARDLPNDVLALLYLGGFPIAALRQALSQPPSELPDAAVFVRVSEAFTTFAEHLRTWKPPPPWSPATEPQPA